MRERVKKGEFYYTFDRKEKRAAVYRVRETGSAIDDEKWAEGRYFADEAEAHKAFREFREQEAVRAQRTKKIEAAMEKAEQQRKAEAEKRQRELLAALELERLAQMKELEARKKADARERARRRMENLRELRERREQRIETKMKKESLRRDRLRHLLYYYRKKQAKIMMRIAGIDLEISRMQEELSRLKLEDGMRRLRVPRKAASSEGRELKPIQTCLFGI